MPISNLSPANCGSRAAHNFPQTKKNRRAPLGNAAILLFPTQLYRVSVKPLGALALKSETRDTEEKEKPARRLRGRLCGSNPRGGRATSVNTPAKGRGVVVVLVIVDRSPLHDVRGVVVDVLVFIEVGHDDGRITGGVLRTLNSCVYEGIRATF